jgi:hypothetical protein
MAAPKKTKSGRALGAGAGTGSAKHPSPKAQAASSGSRSKRQPLRARPASGRAQPAKQVVAKVATKLAVKPVVRPAIKPAAKAAPKPAAKAAVKAPLKAVAKPVVKAEPKVVSEKDTNHAARTNAGSSFTGHPLQGARGAGELRREMVVAASASAVPRGAPPALPTPIATFTI